METKEIKRRLSNRWNQYWPPILARKIQQLENLAFTDQLTGLDNRNAIENHLQNIEDAIRTSRQAPENTGLLVLFADIDKFKSVNENLGHEGGDLLLEAVGSNLRKATRTDSKNNKERDRRDVGYNVKDFLGRYGGEEFISLMPTKILQVDQVRSIVERSYQKVCGEYDLDNGLKWPVSISMGCAFVPWKEIKPFIQELNRQGITDIKDRNNKILHFISKAADIACKQAKNNGRARAYLAGYEEPLFIYEGKVSKAVLESRGKNFKDSRQMSFKFPDLAA